MSVLGRDCGQAVNDARRKLSAHVDRVGMRPEDGARAGRGFGVGREAAVGAEIDDAGAGFGGRRKLAQPRAVLGPEADPADEFIGAGDAESDRGRA